MANTGLTYKNGKLYMNGVELGGGGGDAHNTFNKIVVVGTSIEAIPSSTPWSRYMAEALGLSYKKINADTDDTTKATSGVVNYAEGGGNVTWYGESVPSNYKAHVLSAFSCTQAEKAAAIDYYVDEGIYSQADADSRNNNISYDNSILGNLDADLFIFGTYGINDNHPYMKWTGEVEGSAGNYIGTDKGLEQTSFTIHEVTAFDRRCIYGAYNYVLRALYNAKPTAKVVILGQHTLGVDNFTWQDDVNGVQRAVAEKWQIPFADWGRYLSLRQTYPRATKTHVNTAEDERKQTIYQSDNVHPMAKGAQLLGTWVADWITKTELKPLNPRWGLE